MPINSYLRINEKLEPSLLVQSSLDNNGTVTKTINNWDDVNKNSTYTILVSAKLILQKLVSIPSKKEEVLRQSIPFALEEEIADELASNHFAFKNLEDDTYMVSIIKKEVLDEIKQILKNNGLIANSIFSEIFCCPSSSDTLNVLTMQSYVLIRDGFLGTAISERTLETYVQLSKAKEINVFTDNKGLALKNEKINLKIIKNSSAFQIETFEDSNKINLLQGEYSLEKESNKNQFVWRNSLILLFLLVLSWVGIASYKYLRLNSKINDLKQQQTTVLLEVVPNANQTELNSPYAAFDSKLKSVSQNQNQTKAGFLNGLKALGLTLQQFQQIQLQSLRLRDDEIEIMLTSPDSQVLNLFQAELQNNSYNMRVKTGTRSNAGDGVNAVLILEIL